jgi:pyruvate/2-oxoglutarate dehydrogenase complex dihydrolipoamide dehydrogenase (E3) component
MTSSGFDYDIIILGGGSAGIVSGVMAAALKMRVLVIEKGKMGGECLNTGCVPSKALLHAARTARTLRTAANIGLRSSTIGREEADGVMAWVRGAIDRVRGADATEALLRENGAEIRFGDAHFEDANTLFLNGTRLRAENFILATGSHPILPDIPGIHDAGCRTNQTIFDLDRIPASLLVVGGGPIGVEMAQAFQLLGSQVTLVEIGDRLLPRDDAELARSLEGFLRENGVDVRLNAEVSGLRRDGDTRIASIMQGGSTVEQQFEEVLIAAGRAPNVEGLALEAAGVRVEKNRVPTDAALRTSSPNIYACGDLLGEHQFSHMAEMEAKIVVRNIVFPGSQKADYTVVPWTTFTDPELAHAGLTEEEAKARGLAYEVSRQPFAQDDRAITDNDTRGFVKVLTTGIGGRIIGVHILGPRAGELIQEWVFAMQHGHSIRDVADLVHVYPTLTMASQHAAQRWYERKAQDPLLNTALKTYAREIRPRQRGIALGLLGAGLIGIGAVGAALWSRRHKR